MAKIVFIMEDFKFPIKQILYKTNLRYNGTHTKYRAELAQYFWGTNTIQKV